MRTDLKQWLDEEIDLIRQEADDGEWHAFLAASDTRFCRWTGQSEDSRKHAADNDDEDPMPFEGACDQRQRYADMVIQEDVMLLALATMRAQVRVTGVEAGDQAKAGAMTQVLRWVIQNGMGFEFVRELLKLANWYCADSPAVALMKVWWDVRRALALQRVSVEDLMKLYLERVLEAAGAMEEEQGQAGAMEEQAQQAAQDFQMALADPVFGVEQLANLLQEFFPDLSRKRAVKAVKQLREEGEAAFPVVYEERNGPAVAARRVFQDWFVPVNTGHFRKARVWFEVEWLTRVEVLERQRTMGWSKAFVEALVGDGSEPGHKGLEGQPTFAEYTRKRDGNVEKMDATYYRGMYQVAHAYFRDADEDGVPGRYVVTVHRDVAEPATEPTLIEYAHGEWPGHVFQREMLSDRLLDSRGLAELAGTYQSMLKMFGDSFGDHAQISGVPPIVTYGRRGEGRLYIEPLIELQAKRDGDYKWLAPPQYPQAIDRMWALVRQDGNEYFGREGEGVSEGLVTLHKQFKVMWWLLNMREVYRQLMQLSQQFMPEEMMARITNRKGEPVARSREEIQGQFDLQLVFDPQVLDPEYVAKMGGVLRDVLLAIDRDKTIRTAPIVSAMLWWLMPELAADSLQEVEEANQTEMLDELQKYLQIRGGVEPERAPDGSENYQLRLGMYEKMREMNPAVFDDLSEDKQAILQARLEYLQAQAQQYGENVQVGQEGARRAL